MYPVTATFFAQIKFPVASYFPIKANPSSVVAIPVKVVELNVAVVLNIRHMKTLPLALVVVLGASTIPATLSVFAQCQLGD